MEYLNVIEGCIPIRDIGKARIWLMDLLLLKSLLDLAWWETSSLRSYEYKVVTSSGKKTFLSPRSLKPYAQYFNLQEIQHNYITDKPILLDFTDNREYVNRYEKIVEKPDDLETAIKRIGFNYYDEVKSNQLRNFIKIYVSNFIENRSEIHRWIDRLSPPPHILGYTSEKFMTLDKLNDRIYSIRVILREGYYNGKEIHQINEMELMEININHS